MKSETRKFPPMGFWVFLLLGLLTLGPRELNAAPSRIDSDKGGLGPSLGIPSGTDALLISPSPVQAGSNAFIYLLSAESAELRIYNLNAELVFQENLGLLSAGLSKVPLSLSKLSDGIYLAVLVGENSTEASLVLKNKFVVERAR